MIDEREVELLKLDEIDIKIISMLEEDPHLTHSEIARRIDRSQPAVGSRIHKLEARGILRTQIGVDFKEFPVRLLKVEMAVRDTSEILEMADCCPFVINCMRISGERNVMVLLASTSMKKLDAVVDYHFRDKPNITKVDMEVVTGFAKPFVLPVNFDSEHHDPNPKTGCGEKCHVYLRQLARENKL
ncbi:MAG: winged helix-turn-helix transcriptional regulator [Promethearchaeota archaeon]